jgi:hypothetical protein
MEATSTTHKRRDEWLSKDWDAYIKIFRTDAFMCKQRGLYTEQPDLLAVITRMEKGWQEPSEQWKVIEELSDVN